MLNYKGFKKTKQDAKSTTLKHPKGHTITVAHAGLAPEHVKGLQSLPFHLADGTPDEPIQAPPDAAQPPQAPMQAPQPQQTDAIGTPDVTPNSLAGQSADRGQAEQQVAGMLPQNDPKAAALNEYAQADQNWTRDLLNGHVKPKTYSDLFHEKSTLGKVMMGLGVVLSGAGSGLAHQPNYALDSMNKELERDFEAQKKSKDNAQNFVRLNQEHQRQLADIDRLKHENKLTDTEAASKEQEIKIKGEAFGRMQMNRVALHQAALAIDKMPPGSPQQQQAVQKLAWMSQLVDGANYNIADAAASRQALLGNVFNDSQGQTDEKAFQSQNQALRMSGMGDLAAQREAHHYPGLKGSSSVPMTGEDRGKLTSGIEFDKKLGRFMDWTSHHSGELKQLHPSDYKTGVTLAAELQGAYRQATNGGVYKEGEQNFISKLIDSEPTKFFNNIRVMPQLQALSRENEARVSQHAKSLGFEGYKSSVTAGAPQGAAPATKVMHGATYQQVPGGWKKVK